MPTEVDIVTRKMPDGKFILDPQTQIGFFLVKLLQHRSAHIENFGPRKESKSVEDIASFLRVKILEDNG